mgnify:FL=1
MARGFFSLQPTTVMSYTLEHSRTMAAYNSLKSRLEDATPDEWHRGVTWYPRANAIAVRHARSFGLPVSDVSGVIAALSPLTPWDDNLDAAEALLNGNDAQLQRLHGLSRNQAKARRIAFGGEPAADVLSGSKVLGFHFSIMLRPGAVCIDRHIWNAVKRFGLASQVPTANARRAIERAFRMLASEYQVPTYALQAVVWIVQRRIMKHTPYDF